MDFDKLSLVEKRHLSMDVYLAIKNQDISKLKSLLPEAKDLLAFSSHFDVPKQFNFGSSVLHIAAGVKPNKYIKGSQIDFLKSIFTEYGLAEDSEIKTKLLLKRDNTGKLAANFMDILSLGNLSILFKGDVKYSGSNDYSDEKVQMYRFLKDEIKKVKPKLKKEEIHTIGREYASGIDEEWNPYDKGVPVSDGLYLTDENGNFVAYMDGAIKEIYPQIRLRNIEDEENGIPEDGCILDNLDPTKPLLKQVLNKIDFPEDFSQHFQALNTYEKMYHQIRQDDGVYAAYRYFTENRGCMVFENTQDQTVTNTNAKKRIGYGGYATSKETTEGKTYDLIVLDSNFIVEDPENGWTLLHELYHKVDLNNGLCLSQTDICKFALMLSQKDNRNSLNEVFDRIDSHYPPSEFSAEVLARIMQRPSNEDYKDNPLILRLYQIGTILSSAKADKLPAIENRIKYALNDLPEFKELSEEYNKFMKQKEKFYQEENDVKSNYSGEEEKTELNELYARQKDEKKEENNTFAPNRQKLETAFIQRMDKLIGQLKTLQNDKNASQIVLPPMFLNLEIEGVLPEQALSTLKKDVSLSALQKHVSALLKSKDKKGFCKEALSCSFLACEMVRKCWNNETSTFFRFLSKLPDVFYPMTSALSNQVFGIAKKLTLFQNALHTKCDEFDVRAQVNNGKNNLSNTEKLFYYLGEAVDFCDRYQTGYIDNNTSAQFSLLESKIKQSLKDEAQHNSYSEAILDPLFKRLDSSKTIHDKAPFFRGIKEVLPQFSKNLSEEIMQNVLDLVITQSPNTQPSPSQQKTDQNGSIPSTVLATRKHIR